jgi:lysophospholipase L1-like esterase
LAAAALFGGLTLALPAHAGAVTPVCDAPLDMLRLANPLSRVSQKLSSGDPITIVAIGSSSTAGAGASSPSANYPSRLQIELSAQFPKHVFKVVNRGVNGEEVDDMLKRFDTVATEKPDLVLWQLGTNSVIRDHSVSGHDLAIHDGVRRLKAFGADVILIDPQFAPKVIAKQEAEVMVNLIAQTAKLENVDLFRRFAVMRHWHDDDHMTFDSFVSPDGLHMNDWSYACIAKGLGNAIAEAATRPIAAASAVSPVYP